MSERLLPLDKVMIVGEGNADAVSSGVLVLIEDQYANALLCQSSSKVPYHTTGYAVGCLLILTSNGTLYQNQGSATSCLFTSFAVMGTGISGGSSGSSGCSGA